jgi:hypothetical protein
MLEYGAVKRNKARLLALTGLTIKEFEQMLPHFERAYADLYQGPLLANGKPRKRAVGGGRGSEIKLIEQKLLFILVYLKTYPLQVVMGELFGMSQSSANHWIYRLLPAAQKALDRMGVKPQRSGPDFWLSESGRGETSYVIDGTDRRRQRPKDSKRQGNHYSGKKKAHSDKNIVVTSRETNRIGFLGETYPGKTHDKKMAQEAQIRYPRKTILHKDTGFQGYEPDKVKTRQPKKSRAVPN